MFSQSVGMIVFFVMCYQLYPLVTVTHTKGMLSHWTGMVHIERVIGRIYNVPALLSLRRGQSRG